MSEHTPMFRRFDLEMNWGRRLMRDWGIDIFAGFTDSDVRRERIRRCIIDNNAPETVREAFEKFYNQPVEDDTDDDDPADRGESGVVSAEAADGDAPSA